MKIVFKCSKCKVHLCLNSKVNCFLEYKAVGALLILLGDSPSYWGIKCGLATSEISAGINCSNSLYTSDDSVAK